MFQTFDDSTDPSVGPVRLARVRAELARQDLAAFVVPRADEHQGEYVPPSAERLAWLTGFTGSAGTAVVLREEAALFTDGRYTLQAARQVDGSSFRIVSGGDESFEDWLQARLKPGDRLGYDPRLTTIAGARSLERRADAAGASLVPVDPNPVDAAWADRPAPPQGRVALHPLEVAGEASAGKLARLGDIIAKRGADAAILVQPDSIAWTFNIRGADLPRVPVPLAFAVLRARGRPVLVMDGRKLGNAERAYLADLADLREPAELDAVLDELGREAARVLVDPAWCSQAIAARLRAAGARLVEGEDPCLLPKARKNAAEIAGARAAHLRDGAALARFLAWFAAEAPSGRLTEIAATEALERFRSETGALRDLAFDTIAGAGPNGAVVHYRVTRLTDRPIEPGILFLVDSGGQYLDGTTDVTRTIAVGSPTADMRDRFTRVLKGHIAIATARFPKGTSGAQLDGFARRPLWEAGLDYDHGTGHGGGSYLSVHEGPQRLSKLGRVALEPGMILSNEPGYYREGAFGIRIENLVLVTEPAPIAEGERPMMGFETLTLAPIDRSLLVPDLLTGDERAWLDAYHARVRDALAPLVDDATRAFLAEACRPL